MDYFHVINSSATIQLSDPNTANLVYVTISIAVITAIGIGITSWLTRNALLETRTSNKLLALELKGKFRTAFDFKDRYTAATKEANVWEFGCKMWNVGNVSVRNISIYHAEYPLLITLDDLIKDEKKIKGVLFRKIDSTLEPEHNHFISFEIHQDVKQDFRTVIWLEYEYLHGKEEGIAFLDRYSDGKTGYAWFDNDHIQSRRKEVGV
ncbi:MAG: hypothetical protein HY223_06055 [Thaumarchaeota archaeon]|nr:hypothetical protein [Nitrososphaerota archaeon]